MYRNYQRQSVKAPETGKGARAKRQRNDRRNKRREELTLLELHGTVLEAIRLGLHVVHALYVVQRRGDVVLHHDLHLVNLTLHIQ